MKLSTISRFLIVISFTTIQLPQTSLAQSLDGFRFDTGKDMTEQSSGTSENLSQLNYFLGNWDVEYVLATSDSTNDTWQCKSNVTFSNRGHSLYERISCPSEEPQGFDETILISFNTIQNEWNYGVVSSRRMDVELFTGELEIGLLNILRPGGGGAIKYRRVDISKESSAPNVSILESTDHGSSWKEKVSKTYTRSKQVYQMADLDSKEYGESSPNSVSNDFDFLIGEFSAQHKMTFPNGQNAQWPANATAVYVMGGKAVMEFSWFDLDPSLPDAATTIFRIYNHSMRQWESLYLSNRGSSMLHFNGRIEGENLVLHTNDIDITSKPIPFYVFHSIEKDSYKWYSEQSSDGGKTFTKNWTIDFQRK